MELITRISNQMQSIDSYEVNEERANDMVSDDSSR